MLEPLSEENRIVLQEALDLMQQVRANEVAKDKHMTRKVIWQPCK